MPCHTMMDLQLEGSLWMHPRACDSSGTLVHLFSAGATAEGGCPGFPRLIKG